jgi:hypothetical protein
MSQCEGRLVTLQQFFRHRTKAGGNNRNRLALKSEGSLLLYI